MTKEEATQATINMLQKAAGYNGNTVEIVYGPHPEREDATLINVWIRDHAVNFYDHEEFLGNESQRWLDKKLKMQDAEMVKSAVVIRILNGWKGEPDV